MRDARADAYENAPRDVVATGNDYAAGYVLPTHAHRRGQLLYAATGVVSAVTDRGSWVVPPRRALWLPPGVPHEVHMNGAVSTRSVYVRREAANAASLPAYCQVIEVSLLLHALLPEAVDRLLDAANTSVTLNTLGKAARALGRKVKIELVPA